MDPTVGDLATSRQAFHLELRIDVNRRLRRAKGWANLAQRIPGTSVLGTCACLKRHLEPRCWAFYELGRQFDSPTCWQEMAWQAKRVLSEIALQCRALCR